MVAGLQGAILLIAAKRSDQIASQLATHASETDTHAFDRLEAIHERLEELAMSNRQLLEQNTRVLVQLAESGGAGPSPGARDHPAGDGSD